MGELEELRSGGLGSSGAQPGQSGGDDDSLMHLHKMSTTAGAGTQDYVAINNMAIAAGVSASLALLLVILIDSWILMMIPALGFVFGVIALRQIARSNATQTGRAIATIALLLSVGLVAWKGVVDWRRAAATRADRAEIIASTEKLGQEIKAGRLNEAYAMFDDVFQKQVTREDFERRLKMFQAPEALGPLQSIKSNGIVQFGENPGQIRAGETMAELVFEKQSRLTKFPMVWVRDSGGRYAIRRFDLFPPPQQPEPGG